VISFCLRSSLFLLQKVDHGACIKIKHRVAFNLNYFVGLVEHYDAEIFEELFG